MDAPARTSKKAARGASGAPGPLAFALFLAAALLVAVAVLAFVARDTTTTRPDGVSIPPLEVPAALGWIQSGLGLLFVLLAPFAGLRLLRTASLPWTVFPSAALFLAGPALPGLGSWGPFVGLAGCAVAIGALGTGSPGAVRLEGEDG